MPATPNQNQQLLSRIIWVRMLALICAGLISAFSQGILETQFNVKGLYTVFAVALSSVVFIHIFRVKSAKAFVNHSELLLHLCCDALLFSAGLYFAGGSSNPFVSYYIVILALGATMLSPYKTAFLAGIAITCYSALLLGTSTVTHHHGDGSFYLHVIGMWANFVLSAAVIVFVVAKLFSSLREKDMALSEARENIMRNEQVVAIASLAAGTAHELGTPLSTLKVLIEDAMSQTTSNELVEDLELMASQIEVCKTTLRSLTRLAESTSASQQPIALQSLVKQLIKDVEVTHPNINTEVHSNSQSDEILLVSGDPALRQSLLNILHNSAEAAQRKITLRLAHQGDTLSLNVVDDGPGIPEHILNRIGKPILSDKPGGMGLGLFLANANIERMGGTVKVFNLPEGGTRTEVVLPKNAGIFGLNHTSLEDRSKLTQ